MKVVITQLVTVDVTIDEVMEFGGGRIQDAALWKLRQLERANRALDVEILGVRQQLETSTNFEEESAA